VSEETVDESVYGVLLTVKLPKEGTSQAPEHNVIESVPKDDYDKTCEKAHPLLEDMIRVHFYGLMRGQDVRLMRWCDIHETDDPRVWHYKPHTHKKAYKNTRKTKSGKIVNKKPRTILLLPESQEILENYRGNDPKAYIFNPGDAMKQLSRHKKVNRQSKVQPSQQLRKTNAKGRKYNACYNANSYKNAIIKAAKRAGVDHWTPLQLRHTGATYIAEKYGMEMARIMLGHENIETTKIYIDAHIIEKEHDNKLIEAAKKILASR